MLTAELVRLRRHGEVHELERLGPATRRELEEFAARTVTIGVAATGKTRGELELLRQTEGLSPRELQFARGLDVVFDDASTFEEGAAADAVEARLALFEAAARARKEAAAGAIFARNEVLEGFAAARGTACAEVDRALYADRKREERLLAPGFTDGNALVPRWALARVQAVLLRAVSLELHFDAVTAEALRRLLRAMKFHQLLHTVDLEPGGSATVRVDGASSLFDPTTKYGLRYATLVPAMIAAGATELRAELRGRPKRTFRADTSLLRELAPEASRLAGDAATRPEIEDLAQRFPLLGSRWTVERTAKMLTSAGRVVSVADLEFVRDDGLRVAFELLGYWSRKAVWDRIEAVEAGLVDPVLFAVSERLRVRQEAMPAESPAALYVFKGTLRPRAILERLEGLAASCGARATPERKKPRSAAAPRPTRSR